MATATGSSGTSGGHAGNGGHGNGNNGNNGNNNPIGFYGISPYNSLYTVPTTGCTTVYNNQAAINAANAQLTACNTSGTCNASTLTQIHSTLSNLMAVATPVGNSCSNGINGVNGIYPTNTLIASSIL